MNKKWLSLLIIIPLLLLGTGAALAEDTDEEFYPWLHHDFPYDFKFGAMIDSHQQSFINEAGILKGFIYVHFTGENTLEGYPIMEKAHCPTDLTPCQLGWVIKGVPVSAKLVHVAPRVWQVNPADLPKELGYTHFQWVGPPKTPHELVVGNTYQGYLLKRVAPNPFYWIGPGEDGGGSGGHEGGGCGGGESGGCDGHDGSDTGETGGCDGHDGSDTGETGCDGHDGSDMGGSSGHSGGSDGRLVMEGVDPHSNIVTVWDGTWSRGCGGHDGGGCDSGDGGSCDGH